MFEKEKLIGESKTIIEHLNKNFNNHTHLLLFSISIQILLIFYNFSSAHNIIAAECKIEGSVRCMSNEDRE